MATINEKGVIHLFERARRVREPVYRKEKEEMMSL